MLFDKGFAEKAVLFLTYELPEGGVNKKAYQRAAKDQQAAYPAVAGYDVAGTHDAQADLYADDLA